MTLEARQKTRPAHLEILEERRSDKLMQVLVKLVVNAFESFIIALCGLYGACQLLWSGFVASRQDPNVD